MRGEDGLLEIVHEKVFPCLYRTGYDLSHLYGWNRRAYARKGLSRTHMDAGMDQQEAESREVQGDRLESLPLPGSVGGSVQKEEGTVAAESQGVGGESRRIDGKREQVDDHRQREGPIGGTASESGAHGDRLVQEEPDGRERGMVALQQPPCPDANVVFHGTIY